MKSFGEWALDYESFQRIRIPLVRRIYPQLVANKIVGVQPLLGPTGLVDYLRFRYASRRAGLRAYGDWKRENEAV